MVSAIRVFSLCVFAFCALDCRRQRGRDKADDVTVIEAANHAVDREHPARRIVSLAPSTTEIVYALGAGSQLVGVDRYSNWPPQVKDVPRVGADMDPSLERIVALRPDLVLAATSANTRSTSESLLRMHIPLYVSRAETLAMLYEDVNKIGHAIGRSAEADALTRTMRARVEAATWHGPPVRAALVVWPAPLVLAGPRSFVGELLTLAGGDNICPDGLQPFPTVDEEVLVARAPEVLVVGSHSQDAPESTLTRLKTLPAVRNGRVVHIDGDLLFRPGPRVIDGLEALRAALHSAGVGR